LLAQLRKRALLTQTFDNIQQLDTTIQEDIRMLVGWNLKEEEALAKRSTLYWKDLQGVPVSS
jgi:hypothetical protein